MFGGRSHIFLWMTGHDDLGKKGYSIEEIGRSPLAFLCDEETEFCFSGGFGCDFGYFMGFACLRNALRRI